jgi:RimJ/RimL family protein N-acetyltransferase
MRLVPYSDEHLALSLAIECDPETMKYLGGARPREAVIEVHKRRVAIAAAGALYFVIVPDQSERPAGSIGIWESDHEGEKIHEMGWTILPEFQGRGLATEAGRLIMERARAQPSISAVYAFPGIDNAASNAICRKLGFEMLSECDIEYSGRKLRCNNWRIDVSA